MGGEKESSINYFLLQEQCFKIFINFLEMSHSYRTYMAFDSSPIPQRL